MEEAERLVMNTAGSSLRDRQNAILSSIWRLWLLVIADHMVHLEGRQALILERISDLEQRTGLTGQQQIDGREGMKPILKDCQELDQSVQNAKEFVLRGTAGVTAVELRLQKILRDAKVPSFAFKRVPSDYYNRSFEERRDILGAASIDHLCKSIVMVNTQAQESVKDCSDRYNSKYYVIVVQYIARLNAEKVKQFVYSLNKGTVPKKRFNLRLAPEEESNSLTGFVHNAVTPIGMLTDIPVILSDAIAKLNPEFFWLGAGEVDLKLGMPTADFMRIVKPFVTDCTN